MHELGRERQVHSDFSLNYSDHYSPKWGKSVGQRVAGSRTDGGGGNLIPKLNTEGRTAEITDLINIQWNLQPMRK